MRHSPSRETASTRVLHTFQSVSHGPTLLCAHNRSTIRLKQIHKHTQNKYFVPLIRTFVPPLRRRNFVLLEHRSTSSSPVFDIVMYEPVMCEAVICEAVICEAVP